MDNEQNITDSEAEVSKEEKQTEAEALAEVKDEELRIKVAEDLGIDPEDEPELLDKVVKRELAQREKLSGAIKQKISWREKATKKIISTKPQDTSVEGESQNEGKPLTVAELDKLLEEREAKRDLESLDLPEELEAEVKDFAKVKGISVREAVKLPYIVNAIGEAEKAKRINAATPKRKSRGNYSTTDIDPSKPLNPDDFALDTEEGQKAWAEAKAAKRQYESKQQR